MNSKKNGPSSHFPLFVAVVVLVGIGFLLWGQSNSAATLYDLGILRYRAQEQLDVISEWSLTDEEKDGLAVLASDAAEWTSSHDFTEGSFITDTAADRYGENARLTLNYHYYDRGSGKTVILLHGFEDSESSFLSCAPWWWEQGYGVLIPQQRGYQDPADRNIVPTTYGVYEQYDLYDLIIDAGLAEDLVLVQAKGSAAAAAIMLAGNETLTGAGLDGIVAESVYDNLGSLQRHLLSQIYQLGDWFVGRFLRNRIRTNLGFDLDSVDLCSSAAAVNCPVLFVCGEQELFPGETRCRAVFDACPSRKDLLVISGASYRALWLSDEYRDSITAFFR